MPYEIDDLGVRLIGYNVPIEFYDPNRVLQCSISLQPDNTLSLCGVSVASGLDEATASQIFVRLDGNNWNLWQPNGGTQSIVGSFNLAGAAYQYKINGVHALSLTGVFGGVPNTRNVIIGDGSDAGGGNYTIKIGQNVEPLGYDAASVVIGTAAMQLNTVGGENNVMVGSYILQNATAGLTHLTSNIIGTEAGRGALGAIVGSDVMGFEAVENLGAGGVGTSVLIGYRIGRAAVYIEDAVGIGPNVWTASTSVINSVAAGENAMEDIVTSEGDVAIGYYAIGEAGDTTYVTAVGTNAHGWVSGSYNFAGGAYALRGTNTAHTVTNMTAVGVSAGYTLADGQAGCVFLGYQAGYYETNPNRLFIDNAQRGGLADARVKALVYGVFAAATLNQYLVVNGHLSAAEDVTTLHFVSTVAIGTQPYAATSTTLNTNLNADLLDNEHGAYFLDLGNATGILAPSLGGTGINNADANTLTLGAATSITGGGTIALGGFTLTVPATGTAALLAVANVFTRGQTIDGTVNEIQLLVQGTAGQAVNLQEWQDSGGNVLSGVDERGIPFADGDSDVSNVFFGNNTGNVAATGINNVAIGQTSGDAITSGNNNVFVGRSSGTSTTTGYYNTAIGASAMAFTTTGYSNSAIGYRSFYNNVFGYRNMAMGEEALFYIYAGYDNVAIGVKALFTTKGKGHIWAFADAGGGQVTVTSFGHNQIDGATVTISDTANYNGNHVVANRAANTFRITAAWAGTETGTWVNVAGVPRDNVALGTDAGFSNITGRYNTYFGSGSGYSNQVGTNNIFIGYTAGYNETGTHKLYIESSNSATPLIYGEFDNDLVKINGDLEVYKVGTQLKLSGGAADYATFAVAADGAMTITTVDADAALADIIFAPDGVVVSNANVNITGMMRQTATWHAYGGFEDQAETIACGVGDWNLITNAGNNLWTLDEADGITEAADVFTITNTGDYAGVLSLSISAINGKDFHVRVYNNTQARVEGRAIGISTTGAGNEMNVCLPIYIDGTAGDAIQFEIMSADGTDPVVDDGLFYLTYLHD